MNGLLKEEWVTALRSGDYEQGKNSLRNDDSFCCLGVLCDILSKEGIGEWQEDLFVYDDVAHDVSLSVGSGPGLMELVGLKKREQAALVRLNDEGTNFDGIAAVIERLVGDFED